MKIARTIGLAAMAAMALMAMLGAGSASAAPTALCQTGADSPYCQSGDRYAKGTSLQASSTDVTINSDISNIKCAESGLQGETIASSGEPLPVSIGTWTLNGCETESGVKCTVTAATGGPYPASLAWTAGDDGTLTVKNGGSGKPGWKVKCNWITDCTFRFEPTLTVNGGSPATISASTEVLSTEGTICPEAASLSGNYSMSTPSPSHVAKAEAPPVLTGLCKASESPCGAGNLYGSGTTIEAQATNLTITTEVSTITCKKAAITATTTSEKGAPLPLEVTSFPLQECNYPGVGTCSVSASGGPGSLSWIGGSANGLLSANISWEFICGFAGSCTFSVSQGSTLGTLSGGNPATIVISQRTLDQDGGTVCTDMAEMSANFTVTSPKPVYVAQAF